MSKNGSPVHKMSKLNDNNLDSFDLKEILRSDPNNRLICMHLIEKTPKIGENQQSAVLIAQKTQFSNEAVDCLLTEKSSLTTIVDNDIYKNCEITMPAELNKLKCTLIYPATEKHIEKYRQQDFIMVAESYDDYKTITLPFIENNSSQFSIQWIYNLLDGKAETERVFYEDKDFVLAPDLKWDGINVDCLYVSAIVKRRNIKSIRCLTAEHLQLLKNIYKNGCKAVKEKYGVKESELRVFFHYQPSYYHLHVHFTHLKSEPAGVLIGQAHLLSDVIDNIEMKSNYYQEKTLYFTLKSNSPLLKLFQARESV